MSKEQIQDFLNTQLKNLRHLIPRILFKSLFNNQKLFIGDKSKRKAAICSRRAGKTQSVAIDLIMSIMEPIEGDCAYIGLTRGTAKKVLFNLVEKLNQKYYLGLEINRSELVFTDPISKNTLYITGANTEDDAEKLRGLKLKKVVLDEVASFRSHLNYLIEEVIEPTLIDTNGTLILIGTPSANPGENYFYKVTSGEEKGWSIHQWTILDNPFIPHAAQWLKEYKDRKQWNDNHPIYLREWCGVWTIDDNSLVYKYKKEKNHFDTLPKAESWNYILGVDLGFEDAFAIVVLAFSSEHKEVYAVDEYKKSHLIPSMMASIILEFREKYNPVKIVGDHGGLGKAICEEFNQRYQINIHPAEKSKKFAYIEMLNGDLLSGLLKINDNSKLANEMKLHQWDPDDPNKEDDRTDNHLNDSCLYAWRESKHYLGQPKKKSPDFGTIEWSEKIQREMEEKEIEEFNKQQQEEIYGID